MKKSGKLSDLQRGILRFVEDYLAKHGRSPSIREIQEATGASSTSVVDYNVKQLVKGGLLVREEEIARSIRPAALEQVVYVPMLGRIVAGQPVEMGFNTCDERVPVMASMLDRAAGGDVFALRVKGNSMIDAMIQDGDVVVFKRTETAQRGQMVAALIVDRNETTLKYFYPEGEVVRLQPANPLMEPIYVDANNCRIQGRVLSVIRSYEN